MWAGAYWTKSYWAGAYWTPAAIIGIAISAGVRIIGVVARARAIIGIDGVAAFGIDSRRALLMTGVGPMTFGLAGMEDVGVAARAAVSGIGKRAERGVSERSTTTAVGGVRTVGVKAREKDYKT